MAPKGGKYFPEQRFYVLGVTVRRAWYKLAGSDEDAKLLNKLGSELKFPGRAYVLTVNPVSDESGYNKKIGQKLRKIEGRRFIDTEGLKMEAEEQTPLETETPALAHFAHVPVLSREVTEGLAIIPGGHYLDATVGGGGHSRLILEAAPDVRVTAIDRDEQALDAARVELAEFGDRVQFWRGNFAEFETNGILFEGIVADLGVSSAQLDTPARGFSFRHEAPLDMRMDCRQSLTAAEVVNQWGEGELAEIFYTYGEERLSRRIARQLVRQRPFQTTTELAEAIAECVPAKYRYGRIHPATRVFQALRIAVNQELTSLESFLNRSPGWLKPGGRMGVISFHSLEDRLVKHRLRENTGLRVLTKKPVLPQADEQAFNPRSRSAKLRLAERLNS